MRRQAQEAVAEAARRRLELLGRELDQAGLRRLDDSSDDTSDETGADLSEDLPEEPAPAAQPVPSRGRHARGSRPRRRLPRVGEVVPASIQGRVVLERGPLLLVVALVVLAIGVSAYVLVRARGVSTPVAPAARARAAPLASLAPSPSATGGAAARSPAATTGTAGTVTVDVAGRVRRPGIATLPAGSRVVDAIRRTGGARPGVDLTGLNLARVLVDGEQILVGRAAAVPVPGEAAASAAASASGSPDGPLVNLNTATAEQLDSLPGVGPVTASKILDWRRAHGSFSSVDELLEVDGIGEKTLADIAPRATL